VIWRASSATKIYISTEYSEAWGGKAISFRDLLAGPVHECSGGIEFSDYFGKIDAL